MRKKLKEISAYLEKMKEFLQLFMDDPTDKKKSKEKFDGWLTCLEDVNDILDEPLLQSWLKRDFEANLHDEIVNDDINNAIEDLHNLDEERNKNE